MGQAIDEKKTRWSGALKRQLSLPLTGGKDEAIQKKNYLILFKL